MKLACIDGSPLVIDQKRICIVTDQGLGIESFFDLTRVDLSKLSKQRFFLSQIVREDEEQYFAFYTLREKLLFELILQVKGIGPKTAFLILNSLGVENFARAVVTGDKGTLKSVSGVGDKASQQILLDLKDKISKINLFAGDSSMKTLKPNETLQTSMFSLPIEEESSLGAIAVEDFVLASESLGLSRDEALKKLYALPAERRGQTGSEMLKNILTSLNV